MTYLADFDELLEQLRAITSRLDRELAKLNEPRQRRCQARTLSDHEGTFESGEPTPFRTFLSEFRSKSAQELLPCAQSDSAFKGQGSRPAKASRRVPGNPDYTCCWFCHATKSRQLQLNSEQNDFIMTSAQQCEKNSGKQHQQLSKSKSAENSHGHKKVRIPPAKHSVSYDGCSSANALRTSVSNVGRKWTKVSSDKTSTSCTSNIDSEWTYIGSSKKPQLSSSVKLRLDITKAQGFSPDRAHPKSPRSVPTTTSNVCFFDATKYQLRPSTESTPERPNVPHMGSQRLNVGSSPGVYHQSDSPLLIVDSHIYSNEPLNCQGIPFASSKVSSQKENCNALDSRARDLDHGARISLPQPPTLPGFKSSLASVTRHLSIETPNCGEPVKIQARDKHENTERLISWIMDPNDASPLDASVQAQMAFVNRRRAYNNAERPLQDNFARSRSHEIQKFSLAENSPMKLKPNREADAGRITKTMKDNSIHDNRITVSQDWHKLDPVARAVKHELNYDWKVENWMESNDVLGSRNSLSPHSLSERKLGPSVGADVERPPSELPKCMARKSDSFQKSDDTVFSERANCLEPSSSLGFCNQLPSSVVKGNCSTTSISVLMNVTDSWKGHMSVFDGNPSRDTRSHLFNVYENRAELKNCCPADESLHSNQNPSRGSYDNVIVKTESASQYDNKCIQPGLSNSDCKHDSAGSPDSENLSQNIASLQNLSNSCDKVLSNSRKSHEAFDHLPPSSQSSFQVSEQISASSSDTLQDIEEGDDVFQDEFSSKEDLKNHTTIYLPPAEQANVSNDRSKTVEVFDQNNNQFYDNESDNGWESEFFGSLGSQALDWCNKWEWDSLTNTLQQRIVERPVHKQSNVIIPSVDDQTGVQNNIRAVAKTKDSRPDVIFPLATDARKSRRRKDFPGAAICHYIVNLASEDGFFGSVIRNFVQCTITGIEMNPRPVVRNIRQFIDGLKNYLTQQRETKLNDFIKQECLKMKSGEFLNLDAVTERALLKCVLKPIYGHIQKLFVHEFTRNGNLQLMLDGITSSHRRQLFGSNHGDVVLCQPKSAEAAWHFLQKMMKTYSPLKKLEHLVSAASDIMENVKADGKKARLSEGNRTTSKTDALLASLMYVLVKNKIVSAEFEANYMWCLVHPSCLTGEGLYYLTSFSSAIALVKNLNQKASSLTNNTLQSVITDGLVKIQVPDEKYDNIWTQMVPFLPNSTTAEMCKKMMAYKLKITNPQEYGLYLIRDNEEICLNDAIYLDEFKKRSSDDLLAYKRLKAKFIWPARR